MFSLKACFKESIVLSRKKHYLKSIVTSYEDSFIYSDSVADIRIQKGRGKKKKRERYCTSEPLPLAFPLCAFCICSWHCSISKADST